MCLVSTTAMLLITFMVVISCHSSAISFESAACVVGILMKANADTKRCNTDHFGRRRRPVDIARSIVDSRIAVDLVNEA